MENNSCGFFLKYILLILKPQIYKEVDCNSCAIQISNLNIFYKSTTTLCFVDNTTVVKNILLILTLYCLVFHVIYFILFVLLLKVRYVAIT
jgi:hypothetical protein